MDGDGYRKLARRVLEQAYDDFVSVGLKFDSKNRPRSQSAKDNLRSRLMRVKQAREGGEFLLERTDRITSMWFTVADVNMSAFRERVSRRARMLMARLAGLRSAETDLRERLIRLGTKESDLAN